MQAVLGRLPLLGKASAHESSFFPPAPKSFLSVSHRVTGSYLFLFCSHREGREVYRGSPVEKYFPTCFLTLSLLRMFVLEVCVTAVSFSLICPPSLSAGVHLEDLGQRDVPQEPLLGPAAIAVSDAGHLAVLLRGLVQTLVAVDVH